MKKFYDDLVAAVQSGDSHNVAAAAMHWLAEVSENPFRKGSKEYDLFWKSQVAYHDWISGAISGLRQSQRIPVFMKELVELGVENPYAETTAKEIVETPAEEPVLMQTEESVQVTTNDIQEEITQPTKESVEHTHILGVVPEKPFFGKRKKR